MLKKKLIKTISTNKTSKNEISGVAKLSKYLIIANNSKII